MEPIEEKKYLDSVLIGEYQVGKTSIKNILESRNAETMPTVFLSNFHIETDNFIIKGFDYSGSKNYRNIVSANIPQSTKIAFLVFDLSNHGSFDTLHEWVELLENRTKAMIVLIGNKSDLVQERVVEYEEAKNYAEKINADIYIETSCVPPYSGIQYLKDYLNGLSSDDPRFVEPNASVVLQKTDSHYWCC